MDPLWTKDSDGNEVPYGPVRYKEIVKECYFISHQINTSYSDILKMTPRERQYIIEFLVEESEKLKERTEKLMRKEQI